LRGERVAVTSSGARPLDDIVANGVRGEPDIDALAALDGDRVQVLVWNYHDKLVDGPAAPVTLDIRVPPAFGATGTMTHTRVDATHGNAHAEWVSQGSPATPSAAQLAALRDAMHPVELERARVVAVKDGVARVSFPLPRFGLSLVTLTPGGTLESDTRDAREPGCSCHAAAGQRAPLPDLVGLALLVVITRRFRRT
jgi:xylan 1,4-beta-xylosidase